MTDNEKTALPKAWLLYFLFQELLQLKQQQKIDPNLFSGYYAMQIWLILMGRGSIGQMRHLSDFYALTGGESLPATHPKRAVNDRLHGSYL